MFFRVEWHAHGRHLVRETRAHWRFFLFVRFTRIYPAMFVFATLTFAFSIATGLISTIWTSLCFCYYVYRELCKRSLA